MRKRVSYLIFAVEFLLLFYFVLMETKSLNTAETPYHRLFLLLLPVTFFVLGLVQLYLTLDLRSKFVKLYSLMISGITTVLCILDQDIFTLAALVFCFILLLTGFRKHLSIAGHSI